MKILALGDLHCSIPRGLRRRIIKDKLDLILCTGDYVKIPLPEGKYFKAMKGSLMKLLSLGKPVISVYGNCDNRALMMNIVKDQENFVYLHARSIHFKSFMIVGIGDHLNPIYRNELRELKMKMNKLLSSKRRVILLTHYPPLGSLDKLEDKRHVGDMFILSLVQKFSPLLSICGHVHECRGVDKIGKTIVINPGEGAKNHYAVVEIEGDEVEKICLY